MTTAPLRMNTINGLSAGSMDYWSTIRRTLRAMASDKSMQATCRSAAQLLPATGNPAHALLARFS